MHTETYHLLNIEMSGLCICFFFRFSPTSCTVNTHFFHMVSGHIYHTWNLSVNCDGRIHGFEPWKSSGFFSMHACNSFIEIFLLILIQEETTFLVLHLNCLKKTFQFESLNSIYNKYSKHIKSIWFNHSFSIVLCIRYSLRETVNC